MLVAVHSRGLDESHHLFNLKEPVNPVPSSGTFLSVGTKQQSRLTLRYSHSLMSISLLEAAAWPLSVRQLEGRGFKFQSNWSAVMMRGCESEVLYSELDSKCAIAVPVLRSRLSESDWSGLTGS